jgi:hypothetical protein
MRTSDGDVTRWRRRMPVAVVLGALAGAAIVAPGLAAGGNTYTGCVAPWNGSLIAVAIGTAPLTDCIEYKGKQAQWSQDPDRGARGPEGDRGPRGERGKRGDAGETGAQGDVGAVGPPGEGSGMDLYTVVTPCDACDGLDGVRAATVSCDVGDVVLSGGFVTDGYISGSLALGEVPTGWMSPAVTDPGSSAGTKASVVCLDLPPLR